MVASHGENDLQFGLNQGSSKPKTRDGPPEDKKTAKGVKITDIL